MRGALIVGCCALVAAIEVAAQGRGGAPQPPRTARESAPVDLTGYWVSVITEDWQWRMVTPRKGDYASLPLNPEGTRVADQWSPSEEGSCKAYGAPALLRMPTRVHITWEDDNTLKIESDSGRQTRRLRCSTPAPPRPGARDLQGQSIARWQVSTSAGGAGGRGTPVAATRPWGTLHVVTTNLQSGWLRRNGVPYSENAVLTEYFDWFTDEPFDGARGKPFDGAQGKPEEWFTVTTIVEDPKYLTQPLIVSSNFKKEMDGSKWSPTACRP